MAAEIIDGAITHYKFVLLFLPPFTGEVPAPTAKAVE